MHINLWGLIGIVYHFGLLTENPGSSRPMQYSNKTHMMHMVQITTLKLEIIEGRKVSQRILLMTAAVL